MGDTLTDRPRTLDHFDAVVASWDGHNGDTIMATVAAMRERLVFDDTEIRLHRQLEPALHELQVMHQDLVVAIRNRIHARLHQLRLQREQHDDTDMLALRDYFAMMTGRQDELTKFEDWLMEILDGWEESPCCFSLHEFEQVCPRTRRTFQP